VARGISSGLSSTSINSFINASERGKRLRIARKEVVEREDNEGNA